MSYAHSEDDLLLAGQWVAAGLYREIETGCLLRLRQDAYLPPTHNGRVGVYIPVLDIWEQIQDWSPELASTLRQGQKTKITPPASAG